MKRSFITLLTVFGFALALGACGDTTTTPVSPTPGTTVSPVPETTPTTAPTVTPSPTTSP